MPRFQPGIPGQPAEVEPLLDTLNEFEEEMRLAENTPSEGLPHHEMLWPILEISRRRSAFIFEKLRSGEISEATLDYLEHRGIADGGLIRLWQTSGYERLCCALCIDPTSHASGSVCICRVPSKDRSHEEPCRTCQCTGCG